MQNSAVPPPKNLVGENVEIKCIKLSSRGISTKTKLAKPLLVVNTYVYCTWSIVCIRYMYKFVKQLKGTVS